MKKALLTTIILLLLFTCSCQDHSLNSTDKNDPVQSSSNSESIVESSQDLSSDESSTQEQLSESDTPVTFTVNFNTNGAGDIPSQNIYEKDFITEPNEPTKENHIFEGWYFEGVIWDFEKDTVMSNMMLEAKWTEIHPILEFQEYNGEYEIVGVKDKSAISIEIPSTFNGKSVSVISVHAFKDCKMLSYITIPSSIEIIGDYAFEGCTSLKSLVIPNSVMRMKQTALYQCTALEKLTIGAGVAEPLDFSTLSSLSVIIVDENNTIYTMVENDLYSKDESELIVCLSAKNVTSFIVPENVTKINSQAFEHCQSLENIMISKNVVDIGYLALSVSSVNSIVVDENNVAYKSISGNLYSKDGGTLLTYARGNIDTSFEIPQDVTKIQSYAFYGCDNLESLTIPSTVCEIPTNTILACNNLKTVKFSSGVVKVSTRSISNCASLEKIIIPKTVTHIDNYAFWECEKAVIYCEAHSKGDYWLNDWNYNKNTIIWSNAQ